MKFIRHASHRKKRIQTSWRRPKGLHNKQRDQKTGATPLVKTGYRTKAAERGKRKGLTVTTVYTESQIAGLDPKVHGIVVGKVGMRKKLTLLDAIEKGKFTLLTGDIASARKELQDRFADRRKEDADRRKEREAKQQELEAKAAEKAKKEKASEEPSEEAAEKKAPAKKSAKKSAKASKDTDNDKSDEDREKDKVLTKAR